MNKYYVCTYYILTYVHIFNYYKIIIMLKTHVNQIKGTQDQDLGKNPRPKLTKADEEEIELKIYDGNFKNISSLIGICAEITKQKQSTGRQKLKLTSQ
ncbi:hypothetical protein Mgra_00007492 [Meloidogyne graminicola]|uniref:Uncharacterized protein n=1 Tax=Meloidogyne graminicola TaxID=189291 RepID=A0A8S9ZIH9_9BILA|nr:hypothetical protein Mgra_00007492 [Meloidogyne graminicola]